MQVDSSRARGVNALDDVLPGRSAYEDNKLKTDREPDSLRNAVTVSKVTHSLGMCEM